MNNKKFITVSLFLALAAINITACVSSSENSDSGNVDDSQQKDVNHETGGNSETNSISKEQALALLAESEKHLNLAEGVGDLRDEPKQLSIPAEGASESPRNDGIHDTINESIVTLQDPTKALVDFPRDRRQQVDWVAALDQGLIAPRADLQGQEKMQTMDLDILMKNTQYMPWVKFPHLQHTKWLACSNCHPNIFIPQQDANPISMNKVLRGEYCGVCHDKVAFALFICERCHSVPHEGSGEKWW